MLIPLYPQFAMATTETILVLAEEIRNEKYPQLEFTVLPPFYNHPDYVRVLSESIQENLKDKKWEHLLFSYHGVPERHIRKSDITKSHCKIDKSCCQTASEAHQYCYRHQCYETTRQVAEYLELKEGTFSTSFQSRLGVDPWLQPYTDQTVARFAKKGIKNLAIATPAFVSDCLETTVEIGEGFNELFIEKGGDSLELVPSLNTHPRWIKALKEMILKA